MLIIAEIGQNHNGDMQIAKKLIHAARKSGADAAKFQFYNVDSIFSKTFRWYKEAKKAELNFDNAKALKKECDKAGIEFMASVFDLERLGWIKELGVKRIKIASRSIYNRELIHAAAQTKKPLIVSLGMYKEKRFPSINTPARVDFLYCVSKYPTLPEDLRFDDVDFNKYSGFSDHTIGIWAAVLAMSRGAKIIEKHFTLSKKMHGPDHKGSMEPDELRELTMFSKNIEQILYNKNKDTRK